MRVVTIRSWRPGSRVDYRVLVSVTITLDLLAWPKKAFLLAPTTAAPSDSV